jgi:hypothetical protein
MLALRRFKFESDVSEKRVEQGGPVLDSLEPAPGDLFTWRPPSRAPLTS